ncbi:MAG TPA: DUF2520 domain-containing protein [Bacteroidales bacterium]|nr:MAG: Rossmann-like domain protein [Bacteroidetes bacterium ADurb.Bin090]HQB71007.1 DUF2520 domain-containing protein [Bacteroidales bacterium]HQP23287.1 DUF2520 domain-containing protein [Bacteroidales bacterium]
MRICLLGAGNVAVHLGKQLQAAGYTLVQVYSRTESSARSLAQALGCAWTNSLQSLGMADYYLCALKDDALPGALKQIPSFPGIWLHTSGSLGLEVFEPYTRKCGVLYPLQTFSRQRELNLNKVPFFIESLSPELLVEIHSMAEKLSERVYELDTARRSYLHLAAVFACNFSNHLYTLAAEILQEQGLSFELLLPLIDETAGKVHEQSPKEAQTGPALRMDRNITDKHLAMLQSEPERAELYSLLSESIFKSNKQV